VGAAGERRGPLAHVFSYFDAEALVCYALLLAIALVLTGAARDTHAAFCWGGLGLSIIDTVVLAARDRWGR